MTTPSLGAIQPGADELALFRLRAQAKIKELQLAGKWHGGLQVHPYQTRPLAWIVEKLGVPENTIRWSLNAGYAEHKWDGDKDPMVKILESLAAGSDCGAESCTGSGKTFLAACITLWFLAVFEDSLVITSAPKEAQLLAQVWKEISGLWGKFRSHFPQAELLNGKIRMRSGDDKETWTAMAFVAGVGADEDAAQKAQGFHRAHMLIITEDTPGIDSAIMTAFGHTRTSDHNVALALGNPDHRNDTLHRFCFDEREKPRPGVVHVRISALDHPNIVSGQTVVDGAIGRRRLQERTTEYGEGSRLYQSRIRGISPAEAEDALIRWEWCIRAAERYNDPSYRLGKSALGVDPSNSDRGDPAAIARWQGACLTEVESFQCPDAGVLGERVVLEARDPSNPVDERHVGVDDVGVGASTVNAARRLGFRVRKVGGATKAAPGIDVDVRWSQADQGSDGTVRPTGPRVVSAERYSNVRSKAHWLMREDLRLDRIALPNDPELWRDLCTPTYTTKNGQIVVEAKEEIIKRLGRSPNKGDAAILGNYVRSRELPVDTKVPVIPNNRNTRDYGLERMLARHEKRVKAEESRIRKRFAPRRKK